MDDLTARLEALLRLYSAACDQGQGDGVRLAEQFSEDLQLLVTAYGPKAVDEALAGNHWPRTCHDGLGR